MLEQRGDRGSYTRGAFWILAAWLRVDCTGPGDKQRDKLGVMPGAELHFSLPPPGSVFKPHPTDFTLQKGCGCPYISALLVLFLPPRRPLA